MVVKISGNLILAASNQISGNREIKLIVICRWQVSLPVNSPYLQTPSGLYWICTLPIIDNHGWLMEQGEEQDTVNQDESGRRQ